VGQTGPSDVRVLTGLRRPQRAHRSRLAGSVLRQCGQTGRPCSSRAAGSRTVPHRPQGTALARAQQARQTRSPSSSLLNATTRPQRGQAGRWIRVAPASQSAPINLSTIGDGTFAPPPVSSAGDSCSAHASFCRCAGLTTVASSAAATAPAVRPGSTEVMTSVSASRGSRVSRSGHWPQRGRPCRSREATCRMLPHEAQASGRSKHGEQYQWFPRRCIEVTSRPQPAHRGGEIPPAPAACNASSRSPTARGAGERPVTSTDGSLAKAAARRRRLARPPAALSAACRTVPSPKAGSAAVTRPTTAPTGSRTGSFAAVIARRR
jgi:hypothetical protein